MHQVNASGDGEHVVHDRLQGVASGVGVTGVETEADPVGLLLARDGVPDPFDAVQIAGHCVLTASGVLDQ